VKVFPALSVFLMAALCATRLARADDSVEARVRVLAEENAGLQRQLRAQQATLETMAAQLAELRTGGARQEQALRELREAAAEPAAALAPARGEREVRLSGEVGLAFFKTGRAGAFPKAQFRADDAKIFIEAPVIKDTYFLGEIDLATREDATNFALGELYVDFENVSGRLGGAPRALNVRAGQIYTPFGEEYLARGPLANPLISHSLADPWGIDPGIEAYGSAGAWSYVVAGQNGGSNPLQDFTADKSVAARLGWEPQAWLQLSASTMRTGDLRVNTATVPGDGFSSLWFGNGFFRALGSDKTTTTFWASLAQADAVGRWKAGRFGVSAGLARFDDNDRAADNARTLRYGAIELVQSLTPEVFVAARASWINAPGGYPLVGWGNFGRYVFASPLTTQLHRFSLGFGYRLGPPLVLKLEYTWENGRLTTGARRDAEDFFGAEAAMKF
jgi:hypothetical protein